MSSIRIHLPDKSIKEFSVAPTILQVAESIGPGLAKNCVGGTIIGQAYLSGKGANNLRFAQDGFNFDYQLGQTIAGVSDTITVAAKGASNGDDICGTIKWVDLTNG